MACRTSLATSSGRSVGMAASALSSKHSPIWFSTSRDRAAAARASRPGPARNPPGASAVRPARSCEFYRAARGGRTSADSGFGLPHRRVRSRLMARPAHVPKARSVCPNDQSSSWRPRPEPVPAAPELPGPRLFSLRKVKEFHSRVGVLKSRLFLIQLPASPGSTQMGFGQPG